MILFEKFGLKSVAFNRTESGFEVWASNDGTLYVMNEKGKVSRYAGLLKGEPLLFSTNDAFSVALSCELEFFQRILNDPSMGSNGAVWHEPIVGPVTKKGARRDGTGEPIERYRDPDDGRVWNFAWDLGIPVCYTVGSQRTGTPLHEVVRLEGVPKHFVFAMMKWARETCEPGFRVDDDGVARQVIGGQS